jgi:TIR domain
VKVFISWSGQRSRAVAGALHTWLPDTVNYVKPWMSRRDINAGAKWTPEINAQLSETKFGIICLTPENQHAPWIMFEAGALAKTLDDAYVVPYLINMEDSEVEGPLSQFQAVSMDEQGTFDLVQSINNALGKEALAKDRVERVFERGWLDLERAFDDIPEAEVPVPQRRQPDEILREVLELVRDISRRAHDLPSRHDFSGISANVPPYLALGSRVRAAMPTWWAAMPTEESIRYFLTHMDPDRKKEFLEFLEAFMAGAKEEYEAMRDANQADEHHEQD